MAELTKSSNFSANALRWTVFVRQITNSVKCCRNSCHKNNQESKLLSAMTGLPVPVPDRAVTVRRLSRFSGHSAPASRSEKRSLLSLLLSIWCHSGGLANWSFHTLIRAMCLCIIVAKSPSIPTLVSDGALEPTTTFVLIAPTFTNSCPIFLCYGSWWQMRFKSNPTYVHKTDWSCQNISQSLTN